MKQTAGKVQRPAPAEPTWIRILATHSSPCACADVCLLFVLLLSFSRVRCCRLCGDDCAAVGAC